MTTTVKKPRIKRTIPTLPQHRVTINFGRTNRDNAPTKAVLNLQALASQFSVPDLTRGKLTLSAYLALDKKIPEQKRKRDAEKDGQFFIMGTFSKPGTRLAADLATMSGFTGDIDTGQVSRPDLEAKLQGLTFIAYSSFSHSHQSPKWRFILPYATPITPAEHAKVYAFMQEKFDNQLDVHCKNPAQLWYTPACPPDAGAFFEFFTGNGDFFDPPTLPEVASTQPQAKLALITQPHQPLKSLSVHQLDRLNGALAVIPADDRDIWIRIGLALRQELGTDTGYELWLAWSRKSIKFDQDDAQATWHSFKDQATGAAVTLGTVFYLAKENGWVDTQRDMPDKVQALDDTHFVAMEGGKCWVFKEDFDPELNRSVLTRMGVEPFCSFYCNQKLAVPHGESFKMISIGGLWVDHPARRSFHKVVFMPGMPTPDGCYNLWKGFSVAPIPGDWSLLHHHILDVICAGDSSCGEYLLDWLALAIQHPDRLGEVAVVMKGERGTGKGKLAYLFGLLFGEHGLQINQSKHLVGNFNAHLRSCVFLFVDEALWAGDKQGENVLKGLVTEPTIQIERKGVDACTAPNRLHIMMASNNEWVVPAGNKERRYFVLQVSDKHIQDLAYFAAIDHQMLHQRGLEAMMHDLLGRDLSAFDVRKFPWTDALDEQLLRSLDPAMQWWMDYLGKTYSSWEFPIRAVISEAFAQANGTFNSKSSETKLGMFLSRVVPGGVKKVARASIAGASPTDCYQFPDQSTCRQALVKQLGLKNDPWI